MRREAHSKYQLHNFCAIPLLKSESLLWSSSWLLSPQPLSLTFFVYTLDSSLLPRGSFLPLIFPVLTWRRHGPDRIAFCSPAQTTSYTVTPPPPPPFFYSPISLSLSLYATNSPVCLQHQSAASVSTRGSCCWPQGQGRVKALRWPSDSVLHSLSLQYPESYIYIFIYIYDFFFLFDFLKVGLLLSELWRVIVCV